MWHSLCTVRFGLVVWIPTERGGMYWLLCNGRLGGQIRGDMIICCVDGLADTGFLLGTIPSRDYHFLS